MTAGACSLDDSGNPGAPVDAATPEAPAVETPDAGVACVPGCEGDSVRTCEPGETLTPCLFGCNPAGPACRTIAPSNGADAAHLQDVTASVVIPAGTQGLFDTDTGTIMVNGASVRDDSAGVSAGIGFYRLSETISVFAVQALAVEPGGILRATGGRPLLILSAGDARIEGVVDVSGGCADGTARHCGGPGGGDGSTTDDDPAEGCAPGGNGTGGILDGFSNPDETGGGGGGMGTDGARGGTGGDRNGGAAGVVTGSDCPGPALEPLRGGSGGGAGGLDDNGGDGGGGGGAVQITSFTRIIIAGRSGAAPSGILAAGAGGRGGQSNDGGGGGGAGGAILLEAPAIELNMAVLAAGGGGGGGGGDKPNTNRGENGPFGEGQALGGGSGNSRGGLGASRLGPAAAGAGGGDNTGGGGGGVGIIRFSVPAADLVIENTVISPAPTQGNPRVDDMTLTQSPSETS